MADRRGISFDATTSTAIHSPPTRPKVSHGFSLEGDHSCTLTVYLHSFSSSESPVTLDIHKKNSSEEIIGLVMKELGWTSMSSDYELCEIMGTLDGQTCKERILDKHDYPIAVQLLWPKNLPVGPDESTSLTEYRFVLRKKARSSTAAGDTVSSAIDAFLQKFLREPTVKEYPDLCMLPELTEQTLLENLKLRFNTGHIYTYIGPILVAVNPFKFYPVYNPKYVKIYQNRRLGSLPPHIFAIADSAYHQMMRDKMNQCIVISGESGSGKTESTNFLLHHLTALSQKGGAASGIEQTLLCAGPVLEAFGNAVTAQNNNSSRFGKFVQVNYRENGMVYGANLQIYLLEKSRIISQAIGERNYHVFYYLLSGAPDDMRESLSLYQPENYHYLNQNNFFAVSGVDDPHEFKRLRQSMELVGFGVSYQSKIFSVLSAVLLLGNVSYIKKAGYHSDDVATVSNPEVLENVAKILHVKEEKLITALTSKRTVTRNDVVVTKYKVAEALMSRDAMAKCLYNALFDWIVLKINQALLKREKPSYNRNFYIGILDIFGFEDVGAERNSFEQFCINYANERLQAYFNQHIFQFEQEEYQAQGIQWTHIEYTNNIECMHLLQEKPYGLFHLIDEECSVPKATDQTLLEKFNQYHKNNEYYEMPHRKEMAFIIAHYAGKVKYQIAGFREKNNDLMRPDIVRALKNSKSTFIRELIGNDPVAVFRWSVLRASFRAMFAFKAALREPRSPLQSPVSKQPIVRSMSESPFTQLLRGELDESSLPSFVDMSVIATIKDHVKRKVPKRQQFSQRSLRGLQALKMLASRRYQARSRMHQTVGAQFQGSLNRLMETLSHANPFFIRCIRSNVEKVPSFFDEDIILRQLRYTGMLETVRIRRAGYSVRISYEDFVNHYRLLLPRGADSTKDDIMRFLKEHSFLESHNFQFGHSKIFTRDAERLLLDDQLHKCLLYYVLRVQSVARTYLLRKQFLSYRESTVKIQAWIRGCLVRQRIRKQMEAAVRIQSTWRMYKRHVPFLEIRDLTMEFQARCKGYLLRKKFSESMIKQSLGFLQRPPSEAMDVYNIKSPIREDDEQSDEMLARNDSSREDTFGSSPPMEKFKFKCDSEESSGIMEDLDHDQRRVGPFERSTSLEVEFVLSEDRRLKIVPDEPEFQPSRGAFKPRRQSIASIDSTRVQMADLNRTGSSDVENWIARTNTEAGQTLSLSPLTQSFSESDDATDKKRYYLAEAKKQLKTFRDKIRDSIPSPIQKFEDVKRRASKGVLLEEPVIKEDRSVSVPMGQVVTLQSHSLKVSRLLAKSDTCALCSKSFPVLFHQVMQCQNCRISFHKECSDYAPKFPCIPKPSTSNRFLSSVRSISVTQSTSGGGEPQSTGWMVNKATAFVDPALMVVSSGEELRQMNGFFLKKIVQLSNQKHSKKDTIIDAIFKKSMRDFHAELLSYQASLLGRDDHITLKYKDLIATFEGILNKVCVQERTSATTFPATLGINAFRVFLNEFLTVKTKPKILQSRVKSFRRKRRKSDVTVYHNGHRFMADIVHAPTFCEVCDQFMWYAEKILICQGCHISCHKRCYTKLTQHCDAASTSGTAICSKRLFGGDLNLLVDEEHPVPLAVDRLLCHVELRGLFAEGLYRKSGTVAQTKQLRKMLEDSTGILDSEQINFDDLSIHVIATVVKAFFRELPEPLMTFDLYENFMNVAEINEDKERVRCVYAIVDLLPKANKAVLERLMYHLARVCCQEDINKMTSQNLAVIFAPSLLKSNQNVKAQDQLKDASRQIICVKTLVDEKRSQYLKTLEEIVLLETAAEKISDNLKKIDENPSTDDPTKVTRARQLFVEQLQFLDKEWDKLIEEIPPMAPVASSEDDDDLGPSDEANRRPSPRSKRNVSFFGDEEYAIDWNMPPIFSKLNHLTRNRVSSVRKRRKPSRGVFAMRIDLL